MRASTAICRSCRTVEHAQFFVSRSSCTVSSPAPDLFKCNLFLPHSTRYLDKDKVIFVFCCRTPANLLLLEILVRRRTCQKCFNFISLLLYLPLHCYFIYLLLFPHTHITRGCTSSLFPLDILLQLRHTALALA